MSVETLHLLLQTNAFLPSALPDDLLVCHVPFEELERGSEVETALADRAERGLGIALIGPSGSGKSAATAYALGNVQTQFAPIRVPVFYETDETIKDPGRFARFLLQRLLAHAERLSAVNEAERNQLLVEATERVTTPTKTLGHQGGIGVELPWLLKADAAREVTVTIQGADLTGSTDSVLDVIDRVVETVRANGLTPIIVIDDTDRWLQVGDTDRRGLVGDFFGVIARMLAERGCGLVVAVHETYLDMPEYVNGTRGFLTEAIHLPRLSAPASLAQILEHRIRLQAPTSAIDEAFTTDAVAGLHHYYEDVWNFSLRWTLQAAHEALTEAVAAGLDAITLATVDDAAAAYDRN